MTYHGIGIALGVLPSENADKARHAVEVPLQVNMVVQARRKPLSREERTVRGYGERQGEKVRETDRCIRRQIAERDTGKGCA